MFDQLMPIFFWVFITIAIVVGLVFVTLMIARRIIKKGSHLPHAFEKVILSVGLPKEVHADDAKKDLTKEQILEDISAAEELFVSVGGMRAQYGFMSWFLGRNDHLSFEIVAKDGKINFYVAVPRYLERYIEQQIHAQYPHAQIDKIEDYNIFKPTGHTSGGYLQFTKHFMFPIKTYRKMDSDPLDAITNSLSKLGASDGAVIQYVFRSAKKNWRTKGIRIIRQMQKGKSFQEASRTVGAGSGWNKVFAGAKDLAGAGFTGKTQIQRQKENEQKGYQTQYKMSAMEEESAKAIEEKASKAGLDVNIRIITTAGDKQTADMYLANIFNAFSQYSVFEYGNKFSKSGPKVEQVVHDYIYRNFQEKRRIVLNTEELASVYHFPLISCQTPNIAWLRARSAPPPADMPQSGIILGTNTYRGQEVTVRMADEDRRRHAYIIGMTGVGKSTLMEKMIQQDIEAGKGVCVVDPHGSLADAVLAFVPKSRSEDVIYFNPADIERPVGMNILEANTPEEMDFVTQEVIQIFYKLVTDPSMIGPMFEHNMRNAMLTLMADRKNPGTIVEIPRMFTDEDYQRYKLQFVTDPMVRAFWEKEMAKTSDYHKSEMLGYLISKVGRFVENEMIRNIIGQPRSGFDFKEVMNKQKILIINLSKGQVGEVNSNLLGLIAVSKLQMAALSRASMPEAERKDFYLYIDEFQNFVTDSIATILAEARKYKLNLIMAHQYLGQLVNGQDTKIRDAVFGNAGTMIAFRVGVEDAEVMAKQFAPVFGEYDVINIEKYTAYVRLLIGNTASKAFNMATTLPNPGNLELANQIKELSRLKHGRERGLINQEILERSKLAEVAKETDSQGSEASL
jgi:hypothetical protein